MRPLAFCPPFDSALGRTKHALALICLAFRLSGARQLAVLIVIACAVFTSDPGRLTLQVHVRCTVASGMTTAHTAGFGQARHSHGMLETPLQNKEHRRSSQHKRGPGHQARQPSCRRGLAGFVAEVVVSLQLHAIGALQLCDAAAIDPVKQRLELSHRFDGRLELLENLHTHLGKADLAICEKKKQEK